HEDFWPVPDQELPVVPELVIGIRAGAPHVRTPEGSGSIAEAFSVVVVLSIEIVRAGAGFEPQPDAVALKVGAILLPSRGAHRTAGRDPVLLKAIAKID